MTMPVAHLCAFSLTAGGISFLETLDETLIKNHSSYPKKAIQNKAQFAYFPPLIVKVLQSEQVRCSCPHCRCLKLAYMNFTSDT